MDATTLLGSLFTGIVIAVVSARVTVHFALKKFFAEKWWERKTEAYTSIIEALHHVRNHADTNLEFSIRGRELPDEGDNMLTEKLQGAMAELRKRIDIGSFVISEDAVSSLSVLMQELERSTSTNDWVKHLEIKLAAADKCLNSVRRIAKTELRLQ
jgi:hypothetical protein